MQRDDYWKKASSAIGSGRGCLRTRSAKRSRDNGLKAEQRQGSWTLNRRLYSPDLISADPEILGVVIANDLLSWIKAKEAKTSDGNGHRAATDCPKAGAIKVEVATLTPAIFNSSRRFMTVPSSFEKGLPEFRSASYARRGRTTSRATLPSVHYLPQAYGLEGTLATARPRSFNFHERLRFFISGEARLAIVSNPAPPAKVKIARPGRFYLLQSARTPSRLSVTGFFRS